MGTESIDTDAGSCWTVGENDEAKPVSCDDEHQFKAVSEVSNADQCPDDLYLEATAESGVLCLQED